MKKKILFIFAMFMLIVLPKTVFAIPSLMVGDEDLYIEDGEELSNADGTAKYSNGVLELNNYEGGSIILGTSEAIKIILKGENIINADGVMEIDWSDKLVGISANNDLEITGDGTLTINNSATGIYSEDGKIDISCKSIEIVNPSFAGIYIKNDDGDNDVVINSDVVVTSDNEEAPTTEYGIYCFDKIIINGGEINVTAIGIPPTGALYSKSFVMNDGKLIVNSDFIGIMAEESIDINGGYIEVTTFGEGLGAAIVALPFIDIAITPTFNISDNMEIIPDDISLQNIEIESIETLNAITLGKDGAVVNLEADILSGELLFQNIASKVIIKEKAPVEEPKPVEEANPNTYDNIYTIIITFILSLTTLIVLVKKKINS